MPAAIRGRQAVNEIEQELKEHQHHLASVYSMDHDDLRNALKEHGVQNSFVGSSKAILQALLANILAGHAPPSQLLCASTLRESRSASYEEMLQGFTLQQLAASCMPEGLWNDYLTQGWLNTSLALSERERRMISLCHRVALCELGVDPRERSTWANAKNVIGYDSSFGWLRDPGNLQSQLYLATHPKVYRLWVGLYARQLLQLYERHGSWPPGVSSEKEAIRCCLELRLQLYNTKIALPICGQHKRFSHLDCDWLRGGCSVTPAPQCFVATSPQVVDGKQVFSARFVDVEAEVTRHDTPELRSRSDAYIFPRKERGACTGQARKAPKGTEFKGVHSSGPEGLEIGDMVMWSHMVAHEFTQHATIEHAADASEPVPLGFTRTSEYPTLVAPWIHGEPHQSKEEVLAALLACTPPRHWSHVYTGNTIPCTSLFIPALPPMPAVPSTLLARVLVGIDELKHTPEAVGWLLRSVVAGSTDEAETEVGAEVWLHRRFMLTEMISALRRRLRRLAEQRDSDLVELAEVNRHRVGYSQRGPLSSSVVHAVPAAARAAAADPALYSRRKRKRLAAEAAVAAKTARRTRRARRAAGADGDAALEERSSRL